MNDLHLGVIGAGSRGFIVELTHHPGEGSKVMACCDTNEAILNRCRELYGKELFTTDSVEELLEGDIDAVIIAIPDFLHEEHALAALEKRKAVYLEKPMVLTPEGCDRLLQCAVDNEARLLVGHGGDFYFKDWHSERRPPSSFSPRPDGREHPAQTSRSHSDHCLSAY